MKLSLLSAVRNESAHIREMIDSAIAQSHSDWELLFVDDGSTDDTVAVIEEAAAVDPRVRLVARQQAQGKVSAFNKAFDAATGDVLCIQGGDDVVPPGAFAARMQPFQAGHEGGRLALFKLRTFSDDPKFDGMVLPKGAASSRSGGSLTMSKDLAARAFPIPESLVAEDIWLAVALEALATSVVERPDIVLNYRIHAGNSNPRGKPFPVMTEASHARMLAYRELLDSDLPLTADQQRLCRARLDMEEYRYEGPAWRILTVREASLIDRLAALSASNPAFFAVRTRFYRLFSGRRGA